LYLQQLYRHNKWLAALVIAFFAVQLFINYKQGVVASPFYHYGMFSAPAKIKHQYAVNSFFVNGQLLRGQDFTPQQWDKIYVTYDAYVTAAATNDSLNAIREMIFSKLHWPLGNRQHFFNDTANWNPGFGFHNSIFRHETDTVGVTTSLHKWLGYKLMD
jgi:hypothetical protein